MNMSPYARERLPFSER